METILILFMYVAGIYFITIGVLMVFAPDMLKKKFFNKLKKIDLKKFSPVIFLIGILFLLAAPYSIYGFFIVLLGLLSILKGAFPFIAPKKTENVKEWFFEKATKKIYRIWGIIAIFIGSIVLMGI